jgi:zinc transporter ZupT
MTLPLITVLIILIFCNSLLGIFKGFLSKIIKSTYFPFFKEPILPYALAFAAGAMIFVVLEEVIPETQQDKYTDIATMGFIAGFIIMMSMDVGLG